MAKRATDALSMLRGIQLSAAQPGGSERFLRAIGQDPQPWQVELCEAVMDVRRKLSGLPTVTNHDGHNRITIRSCHGTGKTHALAYVAHLWNFTTYGLAVATAPKQDQLKTRLWPRYREILRAAPEWYRAMIQVDILRIKVCGDQDWGLIAETASEPENLAGYHAKPQLFLVDEASGQRLDQMFPVIEGALTTPGSVIVEIGNPTRSTGEFWSHHNKRGTMEMYYRMHIRPEDSVYVSPGWMEAMARKYGEDSPIYKVRCLGDFVEQEANQLISYGWLSEARDRDFVEDGSVPRLVISMDVAAGGEDFTVCEASRLYQTCTHKLRQEKASFEARTASLESARMAAEMFDRYGGAKNGNDMIVIDMMGVGNGALNYLVEWGYPVVGYAGGASSSNMDLWRNRRVQSYWAFRDDLARGRVAYHEQFVDSEEEWDEYCDQVCAIRSRPGGERLEDLEPKEVLIRRTGKSPDRADASAMGYHTELPDIASGVSTEAAAYSNSIAGDYDV